MRRNETFLESVLNMKYNITDINKMFDEPKQIEANSPLEAVKKAFPDYKVTRDYSGKVGDIVVGRYTEQWYGRGYRTYVYKIER